MWKRLAKVSVGSGSEEFMEGEIRVGWTITSVLAHSSIVRHPGVDNNASASEEELPGSREDEGSYRVT